MKTRILAFAGSKQAGKSTCSNFLHGYQLRAQEVVDDFLVDEFGKLIVRTEIVGDDGNKSQGDTYLDTSRTDAEFMEWAMYNMWPFVKKYSFADALKQISISLFDLKYEQVYGSEAHKNQLVPHLRWENMPGVVTDANADIFSDVKEANLFPNAYPSDYSKMVHHKPGPMTVRDFLQYLGTDVMRKMYEPVWVNRCIKDIQEEQPLLAVIDDCRFENEIKAVQKAGGKVIGLTRQPYTDGHSSEQVVKDHEDLCDVVIDNQDMEIKDVCIEVIKSINSWGWLGEQTVTNNKRGLHTIKGDK